jgi:hypothetical protein
MVSDPEATLWCLLPNGVPLRRRDLDSTQSPLRITDGLFPTRGWSTYMQRRAELYVPSQMVRWPTADYTMTYHGWPTTSQSWPQGPTRRVKTLWFVSIWSKKYQQNYSPVSIYSRCSNNVIMISQGRATHHTISWKKFAWYIYVY